jgi:hypothetical protein
MKDCQARWPELGGFDEAIAQYARILLLNPNYRLSKYHSAQALDRESKRDKTRAAYGRFVGI